MTKDISLTDSEFKAIIYALNVHMTTNDYSADLESAFKKMKAASL